MFSTLEARMAFSVIISLLFVILCYVASNHIDNFPNKGLSINTDSLAWNYEGQSTWGRRYPSCDCPSQSPINISSISSITKENAPCLKWLNYDNKDKYLILNNPGHTIEAAATWNSTNAPTLSGGPLQGDYILYYIHWHWGDDNSKGSEHVLDSHSFPIEMHLVHYNSKFPSFLAAIASGEADALAVVGVLFKFSLDIIPNSGISYLADAIRSAKRQGTQNGVLPLGYLGLNFKDGYYTYWGSLTNPPCYSIVRWIVLRRPLPIGRKQLSAFRNIMVNDQPLVNNYRYTQPISGRKVFYYAHCRN